jgi:hypothetical protein
MQRRSYPVGAGLTVSFDIAVDWRADHAILPIAASTAAATFVAARTIEYCQRPKWPWLGFGWDFALARRRPS